MLSVGDRRFFLFERATGFQIRIAAPCRLEQVEEHLAGLSPAARDGLDVVEMEVVRVSRGQVDTIPAPPMSAESTEDDDDVRMVGAARGVVG